MGWDTTWFVVLRPCPGESTQADVGQRPHQDYSRNSLENYTPEKYETSFKATEQVLSELASPRTRPFFTFVCSDSSVAGLVNQARCRAPKPRDEHHAIGVVNNRVIDETRTARYHSAQWRSWGQNYSFSLGVSRGVGQETDPQSEI